MRPQLGPGGAADIGRVAGADPRRRGGLADHGRGAFASPPSRRTGGASRRAAGFDRRARRRDGGYRAYIAIADVSARLGAGGDKSLLAIEGTLVNLRGSEIAAPRLRIALRAADGRELYVWTTRPPKNRLAAGERAPFVARLAASPPGVVDALVKFAAPGDKDSLAPEG